MMKHLLMTLLLTTASITGFAQTDVEALKQQYNEHFKKLMKKNKIGGMSFALVSKDSIVMQLNLGHCDKELSKQVSSQTLFGLGSVTKVFTGVAVMQLAEQDKVMLDHPLQDYLPQFKIKGEHTNEVTVRNVMTHHSGLPSDIIRASSKSRVEICSKFG